MKNLDIAFPFYTRLTEQYRYREYVDRDCQLVCFGNRLIPFQIRRAHNAGTLSDLHFYLYDAETNTLSDTISTTYLVLSAGTTYDYISYNAASDLPVSLTQKKYYVVIVDDIASVTYYSEVISALASSEEADYIKIRWGNYTTLAGIQASWAQDLYVNQVFKTPSYTREDTGEKIDGLMIPEKKIVQKADVVRLLFASEYIVDALMLLPLMDLVQITDQFGDCYTPQEVRVKDPQWNADNKGATAMLEIEFVKQTVIKKTGFVERACSCNSPNQSSSLTWDSTFYTFDDSSTTFDQTLI